ncbi:MAG: DUF4149 domain-containing protein [Planctomycetota bacterium]
MARLAAAAQLAMALWAGAIACVAFAVAPAVFARLEGVDGVSPAQILRPVFAAVDRFGIAAAALYLIALALRPVRGRRWRAAVAAAMGAGAAVDTFVLAPLVREGAAGAHGVSVAVWMATLLLAAVLALARLRPLEPPEVSA